MGLTMSALTENHYAAHNAYWASYHYIYWVFLSHIVISVNIGSNRLCNTTSVVSSRFTSQNMLHSSCHAPSQSWYHLWRHGTWLNQTCCYRKIGSTCRCLWSLNPIRHQYMMSLSCQHLQLVSLIYHWLVLFVIREPSACFQVAITQFGFHPSSDLLVFSLTTSFHCFLLSVVFTVRLASPITIALNVRDPPVRLHSYRLINRAWCF